jgi:hypothetical protein
VQPAQGRADAEAGPHAADGGTDPPTTWQLQEKGRAFPPNYLHASWRDWLYWDVELES